MRTVGVDLAVPPARTAVAVVEWTDGGARVVDIGLPADDDTVLRLSAAADKVGIDCPLGWPEPFVDFLAAQRGANPGVADWRPLAYRRTDAHVRATTGMTPLSVATDRIGLTAMRAARLQALLAEQGHDVDRTGTGSIVEVYPAAGLKHWGLPHRQYKGPARQAALTALVDALVAAAPWLDLGAHESRCRRSDHAFDAVVAALLARAAARRLTWMPDAADRAAAAVEGWIALPRGTLADLV